MGPESTTGAQTQYSLPPLPSLRAYHQALVLLPSNPQSAPRSAPAPPSFVSSFHPRFPFHSPSTTTLLVGDHCQSSPNRRADVDFLRDLTTFTNWQEDLRKGSASILECFLGHDLEHVKQLYPTSIIPPVFFDDFSSSHSFKNKHAHTQARYRNLSVSAALQKSNPASLVAALSKCFPEPVA